MARGGGQIQQVNTPYRPYVPGPLEALAQAAPQIMGMYMQQKLAQDSLAMEKERLKIAQDTFKMQQEQKAAEGNAALQLIQGNPQYAGMIGGGGQQGGSMLQPPQLPQRPLQAPNPGGGGGVANAPVMPAPQIARPAPAPQPQRILPMPGPQGRLTPQMAQALLPMLQDESKARSALRVDEAAIARSTAETNRSNQESVLLGFQIQNAPKMAELAIAREQSAIAANNATTANQTAAIGQRNREFEFTVRSSVTELLERRKGAYAELVANNTPPQLASLTVYGTPNRPSDKALRESLTAQLTGIAESGADVQAMYSDLERTRLGQNLGLSNEQIALIETRLQANDSDPNKAWAEIVNSTQLSDEERVRAGLYIGQATGRPVNFAALRNYKITLREVAERLSRAVVGGPGGSNLGIELTRPRPSPGQPFPTQ